MKLLNKNLQNLFSNSIEEQDSLYNSNPVALVLAKALANTYLLYVKTQNFHWNVTGPQFAVLHKMFNDQYDDLADAVDLLAEQIRIVGEFAPGSFKQFLELGTIEEELSILDANEMVAKLITDNETLMQDLKNVVNVANQNNDDASADVAIERLRVHGKAIWFLRSIL